MRWRLVAVGLGLLDISAALAVFIWPWVLTSRPRYDEIRHGMTYSEVQAALGYADTGAPVAVTGSIRHWAQHTYYGQRWDDPYATTTVYFYGPCKGPTTVVGINKTLKNPPDLVHLWGTRISLGLVALAGLGLSVRGLVPRSVRRLEPEPHI